MKVVIDALVPPNQPRGVANYATHLIQGISKLDHENEYVIFYGDWMKGSPLLDINEPNFSYVEFKIPTDKIRRNFYKCFILPNKAKKLGADAFHVVDTSPLVYRGCKMVSTIHDLPEFWMPDKYGRLVSWIRRTYVPKQIKVSDAVLTVSEYSKKTMIERLGVPENKITVTYNGIGIQDDGVTEVVPYEERTHFVSVAALEKGKNVISLVRAYGKLPEEVREKYSLKLIGPERTEYDEILQEIEKNGIGSQVEICGHKDGNYVADSIRHAIALVFPSLYEGFGMPVAEGFFHNTPVISSNATCLPEICGGAALMFEPEDVDMLAKHMMSLVNDKDLWEHHRRAGKERVKAFSWEDSCAKTIEVYRGLVNDGTK